MRSGGRRRAEKAPRSGHGPLPYLALIGLGALACIAAWVWLVASAIDFGRAAREGEMVAWLFVCGATVGAIGCLLLMFSLLARGARKLGVAGGYKPRRSSGGRRASR